MGRGHHLGGEEVGDDAVEHEEGIRVGPGGEREHEADGHEVEDVVQVLVVHARRAGLVLGHAVDERVAWLGLGLGLGLGVGVGLGLGVGVGLGCGLGLRLRLGSSTWKPLHALLMMSLSSKRPRPCS